SCDLTIDTNTLNRNLKLCESNRKVIHVKEEEPYPDHPDRFDFWPQLMCENALTGRCYWEVDWTLGVYLSLSYRGISRRGDRENCRFGENDRSWCLDCFDGRPYSVCHNKTEMLSSSPFYYSFPSAVYSCPTSSQPSSSPSLISDRLAVYLDYPAGSLSFYSISSDTLTHIHTFRTTFTEPLYPGFTVWSGSSVSLCSLQDGEKIRRPCSVFSQEREGLSEVVYL
ncbi:neoverrucotoxin subunit beta-like, partial [Notothenia coriiceps]|uniref:Neoverrucotoxin subunit beta-like n=1 Tax=Notothenia coriiceps TaxID=8208 RepID=A0A6I9P8R7_9TELE